MDDGLVLQVERHVEHIANVQHLTRHLSRQTYSLCREVEAEETVVQNGIRLADDDVVAGSRGVHLVCLHRHATRLHHYNKKKVELYGLQLREVAQVIYYNN